MQDEFATVRNSFYNLASKQRMQSPAKKNQRETAIKKIER